MNEVSERFNNYPERIREKLLFLRRIVLQTASESSDVGAVEETLKWGEPSFVTQSGSTIRIGWKATDPDHYAMYFHCKTTLVDTFKQLYGREFHFAGNRAIVFNENDEIPVAELKHCILLALTYHRIKHLPMLGV